MQEYGFLLIRIIPYKDKIGRIQVSENQYSGIFCTAVPSPELLLLIRQNLKSSIIKASTYKVQDTTNVIIKEDMR